MIQYIWAVPAVMLLAALINGLGVRKLGRFAGYISVLAMASTFVMATLAFLEVKHHLHEAEAAAASIADVADRTAAINAALREHGTVHLWTWFEFSGDAIGLSRPLTADFAFYVDPLSALFLMFVSFIGTFVFIYATGYMREKFSAHGHGDHGHGHDDHGHGHHHGPQGERVGDDVLDPGYARFFAYVALFAAAMFTLVLGDSLVTMFIGWEGVGLCSYLLIGYFFDRPFSENLSCADAGRKAFVVNRIGDFGLMLGMFLLFWGLGTVNMQDLIDIVATGKLLDGSAVPQGFLYGGGLLTAATLLLFLGATGKSAQIPLFTWLPDAMAGPTPVSALIHAATMVTAGVYMVARLNVLFMFSPTTLAVVAIVGGLTAFVAAFAGLTQRGIKKALAYSTVSQLGYMFLAMGVGSFAAGIFHVFTHAFFKGCLFLCAGSVIHALHHEEDMHKMGGLRKKMPVTAMTYLLATLCIAGFPLTSGFFSKDEILYFTFLSHGGQFPFLYVLGMATAVMTAVYMGRTYFLTFAGESRVDPKIADHVHESGRAMTTPLVVLAGLALVVGFLNVPKGLIPMGDFNAMFHHFLEPVTDRGAAVVAATKLGYLGDSIPYGAYVVAGEIPAADAHKSNKELILAGVSGAVAIFSLLFARWFYTNGVERERRAERALGPLFAVSANRWWWDDFYNAFFKDGAWMVSLGVWKFDMGVVDGVVNGIGRFARFVGSELRRLQNGQIQVYGLVMLLGAVVFLLYFALGMEQFLASAAPLGGGGTGAALPKP
ncbi:MAG: NADH-quinone oxidoreductase subunit L [Candidatus Sumerlaeia bacterium]|nr:NADH-quinone oxidoreductase subunit L [Candidatus Sumerlaeia bacterium]